MLVFDSADFFARRVGGTCHVMRIHKGKLLLLLVVDNDELNGDGDGLSVAYYDSITRITIESCLKIISYHPSIVSDI